MAGAVRAVWRAILRPMKVLLPADWPVHPGRYSGDPLHRINAPKAKPIIPQIANDPPKRITPSATSVPTVGGEGSKNKTKVGNRIRRIGSGA